MSDVKLGNFILPGYVADKPVDVLSGGKFVLPSDVLKGLYRLNIHSKSQEDKIRLAVKRIEMEPDFEIAVLNSKVSYTKREIISHILSQTDVGIKFTNIEVNYATYFAEQLLTGDTRRNAGPRPVTSSEKRPVLANATVLFCENTIDQIASNPANYRIQHVHNVFRDAGYNVIPLLGPNHIRSNFEQHALNPDVVYISGSGHGTFTTYMGNMLSAILQVGNYQSREVENKVIHFLSCGTGRALGPDTVLKGSNAFVGYDDDYYFEKAHSGQFWRCDSQFDLSMAAGRSIEQSIADSYASYDTALWSLAGTTTASWLLEAKSLLRSPVTGPAWGSRIARIN